MSLCAQWQKSSGLHSACIILMRLFHAGFRSRPLTLPAGFPDIGGSAYNPRRLHRHCPLFSLPAEPSMRHMPGNPVSTAHLTGNVSPAPLPSGRMFYAWLRPTSLAAGSARVAGTPIYRHRSSSRQAGCTAYKGQKCARAGKPSHHPYFSGQPLLLAVVEWQRDVAKGRARSPGPRLPTTATAKRRRLYPRMSNCAAWPCHCTPTDYKGISVD